MRGGVLSAPATILPPPPPKKSCQTIWIARICVIFLLCFCLLLYRAYILGPCCQPVRFLEVIRRRQRLHWHRVRLVSDFRYCTRTSNFRNVFKWTFLILYRNFLFSKLKADYAIVDTCPRSHWLCRHGVPCSHWQCWHPVGVVVDYVDTRFSRISSWKRTNLQHCFCPFIRGSGRICLVK